jgi:hypothetical protein
MTIEENLREGARPTSENKKRKAGDCHRKDRLAKTD